LKEKDEIYEKRRVVEAEGTFRIKNQSKLITELQKSIA
jgi:hypothetical protein